MLKLRGKNEVQAQMKNQQTYDIATVSYWVWKTLK